ncbi:hypothetical protein ALP36_04275 [Pseudomonas syringae pv. coriandricola]|uniref:Uncharacterized protein n=1 Tax=Pseudomonas syringae pv. coriandricola TaxID=264453 RepID=A0A3M4U498_9PSED|nr:hypothetical protein [Pseudomonas syringae group genomosp. 3]RMR34504.1 hypothetical protein ALP87_02035 [Pseudomonas syringae pv. coriandricola]RMU05731.1 hypothetical protein ALP36_04275 [Pseudomonas syringae pv. coriandricola]
MPTMQMAYIHPGAIKCPKCDYRGHGQLITTRAVYCPQCFDDFIRQHVPELVRDPEGKPFDPSSLTVNL